MVVKVYISGISGNKEVKKRQQRVLMILDSRNFKYEIVDIAEPEHEKEKDYMQNNSTSLGATVSDTNPRHPMPPQIFNDDIYCGDYDQFDMANEIDELEKFLKLAPGDVSVATVTSSAEVQLGNGDAVSSQNAQDEPTEIEDSNEAEAAGDNNEAEAMESSNEAEAKQPESNGEVVENGDVDES